MRKMYTVKTEALRVPGFLVRIFIALLLTGTVQYAWAQCLAPYTLSQTENRIYDAATGIWTAPATGGPFLIKITAKGAQGGGAGTNTGGAGAIMIGSFIVNSGQILNITAGAPGVTTGAASAVFGSGNGGGGGGGSGVYITNADNSHTLLVIAGGGGGAGFNVNGDGGYTGTCGGGGSGHGGCDGNGGGVATVAYCGGSGGGLITGGGGFGGIGGNGGGAGVTAIGGITPIFGGGEGGSGIGGGGGGSIGGGTSIGPNSYGGGGGGGGYSGGFGSDPGIGGFGFGGGSINNGTNQTNTAGANAAGGSVTIECLGPLAAATTTTVSSSLNPSFTTAPNNSVTFTATVTSGGSPVTSGTVTFTDGGTAIGSATALNANGAAQLATTFSSEGTHNIRATYNPTGAYLTSNGSISQTVNNHTQVSGNTFCNSLSGISTVNNSATPYPSNMFVSGWSGIVNTVTVSLNNFSTTQITSTSLLLVGPGGQSFVLMAGSGSQSVGSFSGLNLIFSDAGVASFNNTLVSGTYKPADFITASFAAPAPAPPYNLPATQGAATLNSVYGGIDPNGTWKLYVNNGGGTVSIGSWCLNFTPNAPVQPTLSINDVTQVEGNSGTSIFTFTVSLNKPAGSGGVTFDIATQDNSATTAGNDYVARSLTSQTIPEGNSTYTFDVTVNGDNALEPDETFYANVTNVSGATVNDGQGLGKIQNDDIPATITGTGGTPQSTLVNTAFATDLQATVTDAANNPISGATVTFTAPASGASGTFANSTTTTTALTDATGIATASIFTANGTAGGPYTVSASTDGVTTVANLSLTNTPPTVSVTVNTAPDGRSFSVDNTNYTSSQTFQWVQGSSHSIATASPQSGSTGTQYVFSSWSDAGAISHSVTAPTIATTYTASFNTQYLLTTSAGTGGSISPASGYYDLGSNVIVTAAANTGYTFSGFSGALTGTTNPQTLINLTAPASVTANFSGVTCGNATTFFPTNVGGTSATLNWQAATNPVSWEVQYKTTNKGAKWVDRVLPGTVYSVTISPLLAKQSYIAHIRAKCGKTWTAYSGSVSFKTASGLVTALNADVLRNSISEGNNLQVQALPNPSYSYFTLLIHSPSNQTVTLRVLDAVGRTVEGKAGVASNTTLYIGQSYRPGVYFAQVLQGDKMVTVKLVKQ